MWYNCMKLLFMNLFKIFFIFLYCVLSSEVFAEKCKTNTISKDSQITGNLLIGGNQPNNDLIVYICEKDCVGDIQGNLTDNIDYICMCDENVCLWKAHNERNKKSKEVAYIGTSSHEFCNIEVVKRRIKRSLWDNSLKAYLQETIDFCNSISPDSSNGIYKYNNRLFSSEDNILYKKYVDYTYILSLLDQAVQNKAKDPIFYKIMSNRDYDINKKKKLLNKHFENLKNGIVEDIMSYSDEEVKLQQDNKKIDNNDPVNKELESKQSSINKNSTQKENKEDKIKKETNKSIESKDKITENKKNTSEAKIIVNTSKEKIKSLEKTEDNKVSLNLKEVNSEDDKQSKEQIIDKIIITSNKLKLLSSGLKKSVWKDKDGNFNKHRLLSDSIAGVVLGTAGGLITSTVMKKVQVKNGYEDIECVINGQPVASYGDEFSVGVNK